MNKYVTRNIAGLFKLLTLVTAVYSQMAVAQAPLEVEVNTGVGSQQGTLNWNISGGDNGPNILSELTYKDVTFKQYEASSTIKINRGPLARSEIFFSYSSGVATSGTVQDSDYSGNNRSQEYSRSHASASNSTMNDFTLGVGRKYRLNAFQSLQPVFAYTRKQQHLSMSEGVQVVDAYNPRNLGPFRNTLNSSYDTSWQGAYLGLNWGIATTYHQFNLTVKHFWLDYHAVADWNLRSDFAHPKSFEQWAVGTGLGMELSYRYQMSELFSFWLRWNQESWLTDPGKDTVYFADGSQASGRLNEVSWESSGLVTGLVLQF